MIQGIGATAPLKIDPAGAGAAAGQTVAPQSASAPAQAPPGATGSSTPQTQDAQSSTKVVVERGQNQFVTVFKVLDRATGTILTEIPHQSAKAVASDPSYTAGSLFNSKA